MNPQLQSILFPSNPLDQKNPLDEFTKGAPGTTSRENTLRSFSNPKILPYPAASVSPFSSNAAANEGAAQAITADVGMLEYPMANLTQIPDTTIPAVYDNSDPSAAVNNFLSSVGTGAAGYNNNFQAPEKQHDDHTRGNNSGKFNNSDHQHGHGYQKFLGNNDHGNSRGNYNNNGGRGGTYDRGYGGRDTDTGFDRRNGGGYGGGRRDNNPGWDRGGSNRDGQRDGGQRGHRDRDRSGPYNRQGRSGYSRDSQYGGRQSRGGFRDREG